MKLKTMFYKSVFKQITFLVLVCRMWQLQQTDRGQHLAPAYLVCTLHDIRHLDLGSNMLQTPQIGYLRHHKDICYCLLLASVIVIESSYCCSEYKRRAITTTFVLQDLHCCRPILILTQGHRTCWIRPENIVSNSHDICSELNHKLICMFSTVQHLSHLP